MAPPSSCWRNVVTAREIDQFAIGEVGGRDVQRDGRVVTQPEISSTDAPQFGRQQAWNPSTAPRLYQEARPGSDYQFSLNLLKKFKALHPKVPTKSGIMVGLGETDDEILQVMRDMREHGIDMLTIGQYLAPSTSHLPVRRYVHPYTFKMFEEDAYKMGFSHAAVGAMVRSSYHADQQAGHVLQGGSPA